MSEPNRDIPVLCGFCRFDLDLVWLHSHSFRYEPDWFGDGKVHPKSDFPPPQPVVNHGNRFTLQDTGEVFHECGSWAAAPRETERPRT